MPILFTSVKKCDKKEAHFISRMLGVNLKTDSSRAFWGEGIRDMTPKTGVKNESAALAGGRFSSSRIKSSSEPGLVIPEVILANQYEKSL